MINFGSFWHACWFCFCIHDLFLCVAKVLRGWPIRASFGLLSSPQYLFVCFLLLTLHVMIFYVMILK